MPCSAVLNSAPLTEAMNTRREFLQTSGVGFGWLAFQALAQAEAGAPLAVKQPHFNATAKRVIFLCMRGAPSHVDTFDYKPKLTAASGKDGRAPGTKLHGSQWKFSPQGRSGLPIVDRPRGPVGLGVLSPRTRSASRGGTPRGGALL